MSDTTLSALSPEGIEYTLYPAGPFARGCAFSIDAILQWTFLLIIQIIIQLFSKAIGFWFLFLSIFVLDWFYHVFCELFLGGQSPGKKLLGLRVVGRCGEPVRADASLLRNVLRFADGFFMLYHIGFISICASSGFRRLGDIAGGTVVVYTHIARFNVERRAAPPVMENVITPPAALTFDEIKALCMLENRYPLLGEARSNEIVKPWLDSVFTAKEALPGQPKYDAKTAISFLYTKKGGN
jgi:uncharacterized RDD family membrane protein YckC